MSQKGFDLSRMVPKSLLQVPNLEHYQVVIILAPEARRAFPQKPRKGVFLDWHLVDPSTVQGTHAEVRAAYETAFNFIQGHLKDLVDAILGHTPDKQTPNTATSH